MEIAKATIKDLESQLAAAEPLAGAQPQLSELQAQLAAAKTESAAAVAQQQRVAEERSKQLGEKEKQLSELQAQLAAAKTESAAAVAQQQQQRSKQLGEKEKQVSELQAQLAAAKTESAAAVAQQQERSKQLGEKEKQVSELQAQLAAANKGSAAAAAQQQQVAEEKSRRLGEKEKQLSQLQAMIAMDVDQLRAEAGDLRQSLLRMQRCLWELGKGAHAEAAQGEQFVADMMQHVVDPIAQQREVLCSTTADILGLIDQEAWPEIRAQLPRWSGLLQGAMEHYSAGRATLLTLQQCRAWMQRDGVHSYDKQSLQQSPDPQLAVSSVLLWHIVCELYWPNAALWVLLHKDQCK